MKRKLLLVFLPVMFLVMRNISAQTVINSLAELKSHLDDDDGNFVMTPGTYYFNTENCGPDKLFSDARLLLFTGNNCTYDFTDVKFEIDTKIFTLYGNIDVLEFWPVGSNNIYKNLTLEDIGMTVPTKGATTLHLDGADNLIEGFTTTTRGSFPYGYGDTFGKGGGSVISHNKHAGMLVRGDKNHLKNCTVIMRAYGHGIFLQGSHDAIIEGCYVEGELRTVGEMIQEEGTDSPADNVDFQTVWGFDLRDHTSDYTFSLQEAGIRAYSTGGIFDSEGNHTGESRGTLNTTVIDCTIVKMRVGVNTGAEGGDNKRIENCTALACEGGFWLGHDGNVINCRADASVGPILSEDIARSNATYEVTILDNYIPKIGDTPYFFAGGTNHNISIHDGTTYYNPDIKIVLGGTRPANRFLAGSVTEPPSRNATNITLTNNTKYPVILESTTNCTVSSCGPVTDNGSGNTVSILSSCNYDRACNNTADNLQAECFDTMNGVSIQDIAASKNEREVSNIHSGDWIAFNNIDLTNITSVNIIASGIKNNVSLEVRQNSQSGTLLAIIPISSTNAYEIHNNFSTNLIKTISGKSDIYFVANTTTETELLFNLDHISFAMDSCLEATYDPFLPISAENFCESSDVTIEKISNFNKVVGDLENTDYIKFSNVDFGYNDVYNSIDILASSATNGGVIEVRSDAVDGIVLAKVTVENTGSWDNYKLFTNLTISEVSGVHDLYFIFTGTSDSLLKMDNFFFNHDKCFGVTYNAYSQIEAKDYCEMFGVVPINEVQLGGINDGDWVRFGSVDFTSTSPEEITLRLGGNEAGGYVNVMLDHPVDGTLIATTEVPDTGGYSNFQNLTTPLNQIVTGIHELYFYFGNGGFDMDWFQFHQDIPELINLALASNGGTASQSTTDYEGVASRANDGDTNGNYGGGSVTHTAHGTNGSNERKWWQVDLGADNAIWEIAIYGRTGSNYVDDLNNFTIEILNKNGDVTFSKFYESYPASRPLVLDTENSIGQFVRVYKNSDRGISLAEVEVYGTSSLKSTNFSKKLIKLSPNPAQNEIMITNGSSTTLEILNANGALEEIIFILENEKVISIEKLNSGIHFLKFTNNQGTTIKKIIKL